MENQYDFIRIADDRFKLSNIERYYITNNISYGSSGSSGTSLKKLRIYFKNGSCAEYISDVDKYIDELDYHLLRKREKDEL